MLPIPFPASTITLGFGDVDGEYYTFSSPHQGTDFSSRSKGVTAGTTFRASGPGVVVRQGVGPVGVTANMSRPNSLAGNSIDVDYDGHDVIVRYMHRRMDSPSPAKGTRVVEATPLGVIGSTGLSGGPHLHMETWDKRTGRRVNPANYFDFNRVVGAGAAAGGDARPFTPESEEDDMYDAAARQELIAELEALRPIKLYALVDERGEGGWIWIGPSGRFWTVPSGAYAQLVAAQKLSQSIPIRGMQQDEFNFLTRQLLGGLVPDSKSEVELEHILSIDQATVDKIVAGIGDRPVTVTDAQLQEIASAASAAAEAGGTAGAKAAIAGLSFVVNAG